MTPVAAPPSTAQPAPWMGSPQVATSDSARWHTTCFRMPFDADGRPEWAVDLWLADRVAAPLLAAHARDIPLWRFHRRSGNDGAGHQFSLLLYTTDAAYDAITAAIDADPTIATLLRGQRLTKLIHGCRAEQSRVGIEATSDPAWDPVVQRSWPYFIMGVSASWLALIHEIAQDLPAPPEDPFAYYATIDERIGELWAGQGQHAYLHHLSGIYGYKPLRVQNWLQY